jgi:DNA polymerase-2
MQTSAMRTSAMRTSAMLEHQGWLLDLYAMPGEGAVLWLLAEDGQRRRLRQPFPVTFYVAGPAERLRQVWRYLRQWTDGRQQTDGRQRTGGRSPAPLQLGRAQRRELFSSEPLTVLEVTTPEPAGQPELFQRLGRLFPELGYYDADLPLPLRHAARYGSFPLARCRVQADAAGNVADFQALDDPWQLDPPPAPLRILSLEPEVDPSHAPPRFIDLRLQDGGGGRNLRYRLALEPARPLLVNLRAILERHDPDILLSVWGDTWLLPRLLELAEKLGLPLPLNRDPACAPLHKDERSYFTYGQVVHRGRQVHLFGRCHIDAHNAMLYHDYGLEGVFELGRVTGLPLQTVARVSPGSGISAMQMVTALRQGVLVPWHKQQAEQPKSALELLRADMGGLVYQPTLGLHRDVAELDFVSMYPSIMAHYNISPETIISPHPTPGSSPLPGERAGGGSLSLPDVGHTVSLPYSSRQEPGLIPQTLLPLLRKRVALKARLAQLPRWDIRRQADKARTSAHKWLLVTCFGYLGYKNARFGRIEAHEAVTAHGREMLLRAKEAAEDLGCEVLHMYVDGLWVRKSEGRVPASRATCGHHQNGGVQGALCDVAACGVQLSDGRLPADFQPLLEEIADRTGLPISLEGVYRWVAFLPSRLDARVPVANRYFGVFQDGSLKLRGIEARRSDTPAWIVKTQMALLECLAQARSADELPVYFPQAQRLVQSALAALVTGRLPLADLALSQRLSRELSAYRTPSPAARAAAQLARIGKHLRPGQRVRFLLTRGQPGVHAWDLPEPPPCAALDLPRYRELLLRAARTVLEPLGGAHLLEPARPLELRRSLALG